MQVYVKSLDNPDAPIKSLKGFKRVNIAAGATTNVTIELESKAFEFYDPSVDELAPVQENTGSCTVHLQMIWI